MEGWWKFVDKANSVSGFKLVFTPDSKCQIQTKQYTCAESMLSDGEKVIITGSQNGNSLIINSLSKSQ